MVVCTAVKTGLPILRLIFFELARIEFNDMHFFSKDYAFIFPMMYDDIVGMRLIMVKFDIELQLFYM